MTKTRAISAALGALLVLCMSALALAAPTPAAAADNPVITSVSPGTGPASGGTQVTITGSGFLPGATVYIGSSPATAVTVVSSTLITATTASGAQGAANVLVVNTDGGVGSLTSGFFYTANTGGLAVTGVLPASGPTTGDTLVTVTGTGFAAGATVRFGGIPGTLVTWLGSSQLWVHTPPAAAGTVAVTVVNPDGGSATLPNAYTYTGGTASVTVTSVSPSAGLAGGGSTISIVGTGFTSGATVRFGSTEAANVVVVNSTQIYATSPAGAGTVGVTVTNSNGQSATLANAFTYGTTTGGPTVTSVQPATGTTAGGTQLTITGTGFTGGATVLFGNIPSPSVSYLGPSQLFVTTPANVPGPTSVTVINSTGGAGTLAGAFTYEGATGLTVTSVTPNVGAPTGGTTVTITGTGFATGALVLFGGVPAATATATGGNQIIATTPASAAGTVAITVTNPGGLSATLPNAFTFGTGTGASGPLTVTSVTPSTGPTSGGTVITVNGSGFASGASVLVGVVPASAVTVVSSAQITATTPANSVASGPLSITVVNPGGVSGTLASAFTYGGGAGQLAIAAVTPTSGALAGGTVVTITGSGLSAVTSVQFGGVNGTALAIANDGRLTVTTPARPAGPVAVTVVTAAGSSATVPNGFLYSATASAVGITSIAPTGGSTAGGTTVTLTGTGFATGMTVTFGGTAATAVTVTSATSATAVTPARTATGAVDVVATVSGQSGTLAGGFTYGGGTTTPGSFNLPARGFGLFVYSGGTVEQLVAASGCPTSTAAFYATNASGEFVVFVPGTTIGAVNAAWRALFPTTIPAGTPLIGKCA